MNMSYVKFWIIVIPHNIFIHFTTYCLLYFKRSHILFQVFSFIFYIVAFVNYVKNGCPLVRYERKLISKYDKNKYIGPLTPIYYLSNYVQKKDIYNIEGYLETNKIISKIFFLVTFIYVSTKLIIS